MAGLTLDAGALIAIERGTRQVQAHVSFAYGRPVTVPAPVLAQVWRGARNVRLAMALKLCVIEPVDEHLARTAGELLARSGTSDAVDAIVVASAATRGDAILTSDPEDMRRLVEYAGQRVRIIAI